MPSFYSLVNEIPQDAAVMVPDEKAKQSSEQFVRSFQVLHLVAKVLSQISEGANSSSITPTIAEIQKRFESCQKTLDNLPGGAMSKAEQVAEIARLKDSLNRKRALVKRYGEHDLIARAKRDLDKPYADNDLVQRAPMAAASQPDHTQDEDVQQVVADSADIDMDFGNDTGEGIVVDNENDDVIMGLGI